ncbi:MAG: hypothetical protein ACOCRO_08480, partial [Halanaerobiales bacterium]
MLPNVIANKIIENGIIDPVKERELANNIFYYYQRTVIINKSILGVGNVEEVKEQLGEEIDNLKA